MRFAVLAAFVFLLACQEKTQGPPPLRPLGEGWSMPFDVRFKRQETDSELVFLRPGTTFHVTFYEIGANETVDQAIDVQAKAIKPSIEERFEHQSGSLKGKAFTYSSTYQGQKVWVVHSFMGSRNSLVEVVFYLQFKDHIPWAVTTWKGLQYK
jgi:hypothetical protein